MHIEQVHIRRLLGFETLSLDVDPALQLIAGPNNAGKSSFIRVLEAFFSDPTADDFRRLKPLNDYYVDGGRRMLSSIKVHFGGLTDAETDELDGTVGRDETFWVQITCSRNGKISYRTWRGTDARSREIYEWVLQSFDFVKIPSIRVSDADQGDADQSLTRLHDTLEGVLVRSGSSRSTQLQKDFAKAIEPVENLVREVLSESVQSVAVELPFQDPVLGVDLPTPRHALRGMLREAVITSQDDVVVPIAERGTGFQSALVLGILRYVSLKSRQAGTNVLFAVEEPEAFLHPQTQRAMAKILKDISAEAQLLVTTHSPVLVDSFSVTRIARLPLSPEGMTYSASKPDLAVDEEGRLTRYCDATNSELVFASSVILVEGHSDKLVIDFLLERITGGPGGHYALGIAVIEASGITTISHLLRLAQLFGVRAYVLTDKDGVHKNGDNKRALVEILKAKDPKPPTLFLNSLRELADRQVKTLKAALEHQEELNTMLKQWDAFVLSSDLEGLLLDVVGQEKLAKLLGPDETGEVSKETAETFATGTAGREAMAAYLGAKGWNSDRKKSGKAKPHIPSALLRQHLGSASGHRRAIKPLTNWLNEIVDAHRRAPL
ncbi:AAA family ATPase [Tsukamurella sp. 8F]|uniref:ATP-dependent nuclease n=1 Tax=unclassified Tsukamurella TaxID=2633480 RepID=UPI0023B89413|nr:MULTISPECIES: AAA family ATPase [unclassified Tsukamurella]MDF0528588.1 AAA family ATPase [Tsukamurella sp. 8J]MDF0585550.1 AAA family ATPase [Tsukamurella sp. 8F]